MGASACIKFKIMIPRCANHSRARINLVTLIEFLTKILYSDGTEINRGKKTLSIKSSRYAKNALLSKALKSLSYLILVIKYDIALQ